MKSNQLHRLLLALCIALMTMPLAAGRVKKQAPMPDVVFPFYGQHLTAAPIKPVKLKSIFQNDVSAAWREYQKRDVTHVLTSLQTLSEQMCLNDWFIFRLVSGYAIGLLGDATPKDRVLLEHFLLLKMGYDVRLGRTENQLLLMVPFAQEVYEHYFIKVDGKEYYLFFDELDADVDEMSVIHPCDPSPKDVGKGKIFSLLFDDKTLSISSGESKMCDFDDGVIHVSCPIDPAIISMLRDYPVLNVQCYATSVVMPQFHAAILEQLKPQLADMAQCDGADALLHFVQYVFGYESDGEQYGGEKVNFVEESFYYDKNDCEDRAILYAFLIQSLLGLDVQFVQYPGHECTAVRFTDCTPVGNGYYYGKDYYLICDPSYVGGTIGRCMPQFRGVQPVVRTMNAVLASSDNDSPLQPRLDKRVILPKITVEIIEAPKQDTVPNRSTFIPLERVF
jgi:hypothetical protein